MQAVVDQIVDEVLDESGDKLSASAIQAILWVYTRRKYAMLRGGTKGNEDFYDGATSLIGTSQDSPLDFAINPHNYEKLPGKGKSKGKWIRKGPGLEAYGSDKDEDYEDDFEEDEEDEEEVLDPKEAGMSM